MRRIGKSTTIKMLAAMAKGDRELFQGMTVNKPGSPFEIGKSPYSVIQLDFSAPSIEPSYTIDQVRAAITHRMKRFARLQHSLELCSETPGEVLMEWVETLKEVNGNQIVLLIDEYDAPVTTFLPDDPQMAHAVAGMLKPFYQAVKAYGENFHKVFVTGVSKFSSTSMFSGPNQFLPLMERTAEFSSLYGFTDLEIRSTYGKYIENKFQRHLDDVMTDMKRMYNGYRIHPDQDPKDLLYNPWSVLNYLDTGNLTGYWAQSAGSSSVMKMLGTNSMNIVKGYEIDDRNLFANISAAEHNKYWKQMAFQSGYSTIKNSEPMSNGKKKLVLGCPNEEVREWLSAGTVEYIKAAVDDSLLLSYKQNLLYGNLKEAESNMVQIIKSQVHKPTNETEFGCYALFSLRTVGGDPVCIDIAFESGVRLADEPVSRGKYPAFDGAVLYREDDMIVMAVLEMKFTSKMNDMGAISQIVDKKYSERAKKLLEERNNLTVDKIIMLGITLFIPPSGEIQVEIISDE
jgi:hypothetical protein